MLITKESHQLSFACGDNIKFFENYDDGIADLINKASKDYFDKGIHFVDTSGEEFITYKALKDLAIAYLTNLYQQGMKRGDYFIFQLHSQKEFLVAFWACAMGGMIPVLLSGAENYKANNKEVNRLLSIVELMPEAFILTEPDYQVHVEMLLRQFERSKNHVISMTSAKTFTEDNNFVKPVNLIDEVAVLFPTSGSTGVPKVVQQTHRALLNSSVSITQGNKFNHQDKLLNWMPIDHAGGLSMFHLMGMYLGIDQVHVETKYILNNPLEFLRLVSKHNATISWLPNFAYSLINEAILKYPNENHWELSSLRFIVNAGEMISFKSTNLFQSLLSQYNLPEHAIKPAWGMSETCSGTIFSDGITLVDEKNRFILGKPVPGFSLRIVDDQGEVVSTGEVGLLEVTGSMVTLGYFNNDKLNKASFTEDGWYKTGDLGYILDGNFVLTGRQKEEVIVNGINIDCFAIESLLSGIQGIVSNTISAVGVFHERDQKEQLAIFFVPDVISDYEINGIMKEIRSNVMKSIGLLPTYIIPFQESDLPRTSIGKIQKSSLKSRFNNNNYQEIIEYFKNIENNDQDIVFSHDEFSIKIANIWAEIFNIDISNIFKQSDFFFLGGDSIKVTQLLTQCIEIGLNVSPDMIYHNPIFNDFVKHIRSSSNELTEEISLMKSYNLAIKEASSYSNNAVLPGLTLLQTAYITGEEKNFGLDETVATAYVKTKINNLSIVNLSKAVNRLIRRHEMLRVIFSEEKWVFLEKPSHYVPKIYQISSLSSDEQCKFIEKIKNSIQTSQLTVKSWPLFNVMVFDLGNNNYEILFVFCLAIMDGMSASIFFGELKELYELPEKELSHIGLSAANYQEKINKIKDSDYYLKSKSYWLSRLVNLSDPPNLPLLKNLNQVSSGQFSNKGFKLSKELWGKAKSILTKHQITPSMFVYAAFAKTLRLYTEKQKFTINMLSYNRYPFNESVNTLIGNFSDTLLFDTEIKLEESYIEYLKRLQLQQQEVSLYAGFSGMELLQERNLSNRSLGTGFPVAFTSTLNFGSKIFNFGKVSSLGVQTPYVYLDYAVFSLDGDLVINCAYLPEVLSSVFMEEFLQKNQQLLENLISNEGLWYSPIYLSHLPKAPQPVEGYSELLQDSFKRSVKKFPNKIAVKQNDIKLTYKQLDQLSDQIAKKLLLEEGKSLGKNKLIAILMDKGWEQVVAALAILKTGSAYLPIAADYPQKRIEKLIKLGEVSIVLGQPWVLEKIVLPDDVNGYAVQLEENVENEALKGIDLPKISPTDLAYVIFTSGSTGEPKGVMIQHEAAVNTIQSINKEFSVSEKDNVLAISSLNFDLSVYDIFGLLAVGGMVVMPPAKQFTDPNVLARLVKEENITLWNTVPSFAQVFYDCVEEDKETYSTLRLMLLSGDWIPLKLPKQLHRRLPKLEIISLGGATEASIWSILFPIGNVNSEWKSIPYGKAMHNQSIYVLNQTLEKTPVGVIGEIYIGGVGLAKGYWGDDKKTNASFIYHPVTKERIYKTGDLGRLLPDDNVELIGRVDNQVKLQGFRVNLGEIESVLESMTLIKQAVVSVGELVQDEKQLFAYIIPDQNVMDQPCFIEQVSKFLKDRLPYYMLPRHFMILNKLPVTANGKIDRNNLPEFNFGKAKKQKVKKTMDNVEKQLKNLWEEVLEIEDVSLDDNFYHLGGHSLSAARLILKINKTFKLQLPISVLSEKVTLRDQSELIRNNKVQSVSNLVAINNKGSQVPVYCVHAIGGQVISYNKLALAIGIEQPFIAIQSESSLNKDFKSLEEMANCYLDQIKANRPQGPYYLMGWSFGGLVALEMMRKLVQQGDAQVKCIMIDTRLPKNMSNLNDDFQIIKQFGLDVAEQFQIKLSFNEKYLTLEETLNHLFKQFKKLKIFPRDYAYHSFEILYSAYCRNLKAMRAYKPKKINQTVYHIVAQDSISRLEDYVDWNEVAKEIREYVIPGDHYSIIAGNDLNKLAETVQFILKN